MNNAPKSESEHHASPSELRNTNGRDELDRLFLLHRYLSECMGGILPAMLDLSQVKRVLDVECGAGGWVYDLAWRYPSLFVVGTESRTDLANEAHLLARRTGNAEVIVQDIRALSEHAVPLEAFDMVHARFLMSKLTPQEYPFILADLVLRCRKGGMFVWEETECPLTNSPACEQFYRLVQDALRAANRAFSPGHSLGITALMSGWLKAAGCRVTLDTAYALDISAGMNGHVAFQLLMEVICNRLRSFITQMGVTTEPAYEAASEQARQEIADAGFRGVIYMRTVVGTPHVSS